MLHIALDGRTGGSLAYFNQSTDQIEPKVASPKNTNWGLDNFTRVGTTSIPAAAPRYIPEVVRETDLDLSFCGDL